MSEYKCVQTGCLFLENLYSLYNIKVILLTEAMPTPLWWLSKSVHWNIFVAGLGESGTQQNTKRRHASGAAGGELHPTLLMEHQCVVLHKKYFIMHLYQNTPKFI